MTASAARPAALRGHIWYEALKVWYRPIRGRSPGRRPSPDHVFCPDLPGWVYIPTPPASDDRHPV